MNDTKRFSLLLSSLLFAGSCAGLGSLESDELADRNRLTRAPGICKVLQRIDNSNAWQEYTQEELNASVKMKLGEDLDDVVKELLPGIGGLQYSEGNIVYVIPGGGETDYQNPGEYHDDHHGYCFTRKYVASGITDKQCTNMSTQGNYVGHPTYRELTVDDKHYYSLNQNHIVDKAEIINSDGQIAVTYFDRNEDRTMDEYIKGYDRDLSDLFRLPTKFDANGSCNLVHADRGLKPVLSLIHI